MTMTATTPIQSRARPLRVVVADDHHHVLPEIHLALRRRVLPFAGVHVVHFDAHPDLSFSSAVNAALVFKPDELYDALDASPSGIAEFLLPLVYAGHVDRITWIKPHWATQIQAGATMERIAIGRRVDSDCLAVSCPWPHFVDDDLYTPESALDATTIKRWDLSVTQDPLVVAASIASTTSSWVLDIDLDYFSTWNPFRKNLETVVTPDQLEMLTFVFTQPTFKKLTSPLSPETRVRERQRFLHTMNNIQQLSSSERCTASARLVDSLVGFYGDEANTTVSLEAFLDLVSSTDDATSKAIWHAAPCLDLPHHESSDAEIETLLTAFEAFLDRVHVSNPPALVTIATSVSDRFLPPHQLDWIKTRVLAMLEVTLGPLQVEELEYDDAVEEDESL